MSIRMRLTLWYSTILAITLLAFGVVLYFASSYILMYDKKGEMRDVSREIESQIVTISIVTRNDTRYQTTLPSLDQFKYPGYILQVINSQGEVTAKTLDRVLPLLYNKNKVEEGKLEYAIQQYGNTSLLVLNKPISVLVEGSSTQVGVLQVAVIIDNIVNILETLKLAVFTFSVLTVLLAASLGWYLARKALKPIENVILAADQIEKGTDLGVRISYEGPKDEIGRLTDTVNSMLGRIQGAYTELEESDRAQRRFVSDASHELRTPLTTIRGNVDLLEKMWGKQNVNPAALADPEKMAISLEAMQDISGEAARMSRLVNDLLALARADAGSEMVKEAVLISEVVEEAARKAQHLPRTAEWQVGDLAALQGIGVTGSKDHLQQMLFIFIENAFKYTPEGSVCLDAVIGEHQVGIRITDTGIGMDKDEVPHIFERFYRADVSRGVTSGTGLGLSIAKWIIDEHKGSIEVTTRKGQGSTFVIWLPVFFHQMGE